MIFIAATILVTIIGLSIIMLLYGLGTMKSTKESFQIIQDFLDKYDKLANEENDKQQKDVRYFCDDATYIKLDPPPSFLWNDASIKMKPFCECGCANEWITLTGSSKFWGCKECYHKRMRGELKLVKK